MLSVKLLIKKPIITEQSMKLAGLGFYTFAVDRDANKREISQVVEKKFNVEVVSVRTINIKGKLKNQRSKRGVYKTQDLKKAIVGVKKGQKIALFEAILNPKEEPVVTTGEPEVKEKKSLLKGTKVKIEKVSRPKDDRPLAQEEKEEKS